LTGVIGFILTGALALCGAIDLIVAQAASRVVLIHDAGVSFSFTAWMHALFIALAVAQLGVTYFVWFQHRAARANFACRRVKANLLDRLVFAVARCVGLVDVAAQKFFDVRIRVEPDSETVQ
jgi:lipoprotein signal peptidase